jgi:hypothetical protein
MDFALFAAGLLIAALIALWLVWFFSGRSR